MSESRGCSQWVKRTELLDADGSIYGPTYHKLIEAAIAALSCNSLFMDNQWSVNAVKQKILKDTLDDFLNPILDDPKKIIDLAESASYLKAFLSEYLARKDSGFPTYTERDAQTHEGEMEWQKLMSNIRAFYPEFLSKVLILANGELFHEWIEMAKAGSVQEFHLRMATNRLLPSQDYGTSVNHRTGEFAADLPKIVAELEKRLRALKLDVKVSSSMLAVPDVFETVVNSDWRVGDNFSLIGVRGEDRVKHYSPRKHYDRSKVTIMYLNIHDTYSAHPNAKHVVCFRDDNGPIRKQLEEFYRAHSDWIPNEVTFEIVHYENKERSKPRVCIRGTGEFDRCYARTMLAMVQSAYDSPIVKDPILAKFHDRHGVWVVDTMNLEEMEKYRADARDLKIEPLTLKARNSRNTTPRFTLIGSGFISGSESGSSSRAASTSSSSSVSSLSENECAFR